MHHEQEFFESNNFCVRSYLEKHRVIVMRLYLLYFSLKLALAHLYIMGAAMRCLLVFVLISTLAHSADFEKYTLELVMPDATEVDTWGIVDEVNKISYIARGNTSWKVLFGLYNGKFKMAAAVVSKANKHTAVLPCRDFIKTASIDWVVDINGKETGELELRICEQRTARSPYRVFADANRFSQVCAMEFFNEYNLVFGYKNGEAAFFDLLKAELIILSKTWPGHVKAIRVIGPNAVAIGDTAGFLKFWHFPLKTLIRETKFPAQPIVDILVHKDKLLVVTEDHIFSQPPLDLCRIITQVGLKTTKQEYIEACNRVYHFIDEGIVFSMRHNAPCVYVWNLAPHTPTYRIEKPTEINSPTDFCAFGNHIAFVEQLEQTLIFYISIKEFSALS